VSAIFAKRVFTDTETGIGKTAVAGFGAKITETSGAKTVFAIRAGGAQKRRKVRTFGGFMFPANLPIIVARCFHRKWRTF